jgi:protein SCO1/2
MRGKILKGVAVVAGLLAVAVASVWVGLLVGGYDPAGGGDQTAAQGGGSTIGGPFTLVNTQGETVRAADFRGQYMLVYFGYTYCPDVCPTSLVDMSRGLNRLAETAPGKARQVTPVFITVDPARDDVPLMRAYVKNFHDRMVGLTGSPEQIKAAAGEYHVYYEKAQADRPEGEYLMNHSSYIYLIGPEGRYVDHFSHKTKADAIAEKLNTLVAAPAAS